MTHPRIGGRGWKMQAYLTGYGRRTRRSIRSQFITPPRKPHGGIRCLRRATACGRSGNMHSRTPSRSGRSTKIRTWCAFRGFWSRIGPYSPISSQWLAPHDVRTGFYRYLKPGQPPDDKLHILGKITATAPMCKRDLCSGPVNPID